MFNFLISISYGITVNNETKEIKKLLDTLIPLIDRNDEIIVLQDITNENFEVTAILESYGKKIKRIKSSLNGDFATFKNNLIKESTKKYLFQIDADEYPADNLIKTLKRYLFKERKIECFFVPRINIVEGITEEYIQKMNWRINEEGYINFPDYQPRIIKNNKKIFWKNKVHEFFYGYKKFRDMPQDYDRCLIHQKSFDKQKKQNDFYETLD
ncbi:glycosyltransferase [Epilithonimonas sp. UC225_85]|uniref:glycosyltransferase n=1 Tax=Epilithonimonas sp. UC225_85 TaxID=3350167 RepID=UPI0036D3BE38